MGICFRYLFGIDLKDRLSPNKGTPLPKFNSTINLDGYATVAERLGLFYKDWPTGRITTKLIARDQRQIIVKAFVYRTSDDLKPAATGYAAEREGDGEINTVACLENTETSAIGRALANLGFTASKKRPSREEMLKAARARQRSSPERQERPQNPGGNDIRIIRDFLDMVSTAEHYGLGAQRVRVLRESVADYPNVPSARIEKLERRVRNWLRRRHM